MAKGIKAVICVVAAAAIAAGGYYMGYTNHTSSIISAIPKQTVNSPAPGETEKAPEKLPDSEKSEGSREEKKEENSDAGKYIGKSTSSAAEDTWSKIDSYAFDINSDNFEETVTLYTSAETDSSGVLWNDSQKWLLEVKAEDGYYILFNQNISNGRVYFDLDEISDGTYAITVYTITSAGKSIKQYTYSKTGFVEKQVFAAGSVNSLHSGIPAYK